MDENICAISTALGVGAISIVRATGPDVIKIINSIFKGKDLTKVASHTLNYGHIVENGEVVDEVLVSIMKSPHTFTGEDIGEINCHGGVATTKRILELLLTHGFRLAEPGEFTKRAFLNGRIDLVEAESVNDLIAAETESSRKYAMNRLEGNISRIIKDVRQELVELRAHFEVNFDYPEEMDNPEITHAIVLEKLESLREKLEKLLETSQNGQLIKNGLDVAIIGRPNVGKSSILNHLLDENKAIVTDIAGTTRDIVEGSITLEGIKINLIDTAGIRDTSDIVEHIGVEKSLEILKRADLVIFVFSNDEELTPLERNLLKSNFDVKKIIFINKDDLTKKIKLDDIDGQVVYGNTVTPTGLDDLKDAIIAMFNLDEIASKDYNYLANARQIALVKNANTAILNAIESTKNSIPLEMVAIDIDEAYNFLGEIIGATYKDELLDEIFSKFCLGK